MSTTGEHPAVSEPQPTTVHAEVLSFARKVLGSQAVATLLLMSLGIAGYRALAAESHDGGVAAVAPVAAELERVKSQVNEMLRDAGETRRRLERTELISIETNANMRLLMQRFGVQPVQLDPRDGGQ